MKLPNGHQAVVDDSKLHGYCLNLQHARGRNKARVSAAFGINRSDADVLRDALLKAARSEDAVKGTGNEYGQRYVIDFDLAHRGRTVRIRSTGIIRIGENHPRLTTCYVR